MNKRKFVLELNNKNEAFAGLQDALNAYYENKNANSVLEVDNTGEIIRTLIFKGSSSVELCPHCEQESLIKNEFRLSHCTECGKVVKPCSMCNKDKVKCSECPLVGKFGHRIGGKEFNLSE